MAAREVILGIVGELKHSLYADDCVKMILNGLVAGKILPENVVDRTVATAITNLLKSELFAFVVEKIIKEGMPNVSGGAKASVWGGNFRVPGMAPGMEAATKPSEPI